jgi:serine/threonine protein kinase
MSDAPAVIERNLEASPGFRLTSRLGEGGFGEVWEGVGPNGEKMAFKFINCTNRRTNVVANEIRLLVKLRELQHPNILQLYTVLTRSQFIIVAMELADGGLHDLYDEYVREHGMPLPAPFLVDVLGQAAQGLDFLASQRLSDFGPLGCQHCDVKPSNLLFVGDTLKVADFGLCGAQADLASRNNRRGTPRYAAPELHEGRISERTDQFSLGVTYTELRTGHLPYVHGCKLNQTDPPDLSGMSERERPIVARALERKSLNRWPNCVEFIKALEQAVKADEKVTPVIPTKSIDPSA